VLLGQYVDDEPLHLKLSGNYLGTPKSFRALFNDGQRWANSRATLQQKKQEPRKTIDFGSEEYEKLVERPVMEGRQSSIALRGEILLDVDGETVLIRNPVVPSDLAAAGAAPTARRTEDRAAIRLLEAEE